MTAPDDATAKASDVVARFEQPAGAMDANAASLTFTVENNGASPVSINRDAISHAIFALEVFDATGKRRYTVPPGVPPRDYKPRIEALGPGDRWRIELALNVFSPPLEPGKYTAKLQLPVEIQTDSVTFSITR